MIYFTLQLLSKMAPLIGKDMSEAIFLERFAALCVDPLFHVRKVCAANFGDFSSVVGMESTEKVLVSHATFSMLQPRLRFKVQRPPPHYSSTTNAEELEEIRRTKSTNTWAIDLQGHFYFLAAQVLLPLRRRGLGCEKGLRRRFHARLLRLFT